MARTIRFHLDENCDPRIGAGLRLHGIDVTTTPEVGLIGTSDEAQLNCAASAGRVIITNDTDFLRLHAAGAAHTGIVFCSSQHRSLGELIRLLVLIWELLELGEMQGHVEYL